MLGTLFDASGESKPAFAREFVSLVRGGLRSRSTTTAQVGAARLIADGLCVGGVWLIAELFAVRFSNAVRLGAFQLGGAWELALLGAALLVGLVGYDRIAGLGALGFFGVLIGNHWKAFNTPGSVLLPDMIVLVIWLGPMIITPRRRPRDLRRVAWFIVIAAAGLAFYRNSAGLVALYLSPVVVALPFALALLPTDPRLAIGCSVVAAFVGMIGIADGVREGPPGVSLPLIVAVLTATPLILVFAATRTRSLQRRGPT
jgi:hypothetical protein